MAVIGLAGTGALPEDFDSRLSHLKRVFIATDPDEPGRKAAEKLHGEARPPRLRHAVAQ
jgi:5S rRNA maturation endonuclease (ribonuclease M5)